MKRLSTLSVFFIALVAQSQNTTPFWSLNGNNNATLSQKLGTSNNISLRFITNNLERLKIMSTGIVGIGTSSPAASALLDVSSTSKGVIFPRMNTAQRNAILSPANGLLIYQTDGVSGYYYYNKGWKPLGGSSQNNTPTWSLGGNAEATIANMIGTTNYVSLRFVTNNIERMKILKSGNVGIGTHNPSAKLQVSAPVGTNAFLVQVNSQAKLFVHNNGGVSLGGGSMPPANGVFVSGNMGIGTNRPASRLHVKDGTVTVNSANGTTAIYAETDQTEQEVDGNILPTEGTGIYGVGGSFGVIGSGTAAAVAGPSGTGVFGDGSAAGTFGTGGEVGAYGEQLGEWNGSNYGMQGYSRRGIGGVFSSEENIGLRVTGGSESPAATFDGAVYATEYFETSDIGLKDSVQRFSNAMAKINQLNPSVYKFKKEGKLSALNLPKGTHYGLIAQEVEKIFPGLVREFKDMSLHSPQSRHKEFKNGIPVSVSAAKVENEFMSIKAVNYTGLIPIMVKGIQEMDSTIVASREEIKQLKKELTELREMLLALGGQSGRNAAWIKQNTPNPFKGSAMVQYFIPAEARSAKIVLTNARGQLLKEWTVSGNGTVSIQSGTMAAGTYNYSLITDGETIMTKQLIIAR